MPHGSMNLVHSYDTGLYTRNGSSPINDNKKMINISQRLEKQKKDLIANVNTNGYTDENFQMTDQEQYLCKRWEKEIVSKTIKNKYSNHLNSMHSIGSVEKNNTNNNKLFPKIIGSNRYNIQ